MERFARKCSATGKGMNEGYCVNDGDLYFSEESHLIDWLRTDQDYKDMSNEDMLNQAYEDEVYYYTEWDAYEDEDEWYDEDGNEFNN